MNVDDTYDKYWDSDINTTMEHGLEKIQFNLQMYQLMLIQLVKVEQKDKDQQYTEYITHYNLTQKPL